MPGRITHYRNQLIALEAQLTTPGDHQPSAGGSRRMDRDADGNDVPSEVELLRLSLPRRGFTLSQVKYVSDRVQWLYKNRELVGGLEFSEEPKVLRFFVGHLKPNSDWTQKLVAKFREDFPNGI